MMTGAGAEDVSEFIVPAAEPGRGSGTFEAAHRSVPAFEVCIGMQLWLWRSFGDAKTLPTLVS